MSVEERLKIICEIADLSGHVNGDYSFLFLMNLKGNIKISKKALKLANKLYKEIFDMPKERRLDISRTYKKEVEVLLRKINLY